MEKKKCFADYGGRCLALKKKECKNCKFYRTDVQYGELERDVRGYGGPKK